VKFLKDLFCFSSRERKGILVLTFIVFVILGIRLWIAFGPSPPVLLSDEELAEADAFINRLAQTDENSSRRESSIPGRHYYKNDLVKTDTGISESINTWQKSYSSTGNYQVRKKILIEINSADTIKFKELRGIGPVLAGRIVKYRNILGGFYSVMQIREVYGISDSLFMSISGMMFADTTACIRKININTANIDELSRHPYIGRYYAAGIIKYRDFAGKISGIDEMMHNNLLPEGIPDKIVNYLNF
jgi:DNA uptake protein ComE-like DNA-binding protein